MSANNQDRSPGTLIAIEGLDGAGKSTQVRLLKTWLESRSLRVHVTEWNSSPLVRDATRIGKRGHLLTPITFSLIHCTDFADRHDRFIRPLVKDGAVVLADRYVYTAYARDTARGCDPSWLRNLYSFAIRPELTIYLKIPAATALERILQDRSKLKFHEAGMDRSLSLDPHDSFRIFQSRIEEEYERLADEFGFVEIDGTATTDTQHAKIRSAVEECLQTSGVRDPKRPSFTPPSDFELNEDPDELDDDEA
jgi:dTMP kinase